MDGFVYDHTERLTATTSYIMVHRNQTAQKSNHRARGVAGEGVFP
jgi:hypothetical protein